MAENFGESRDLDALRAELAALVRKSADHLNDLGRIYRRIHELSERLENLARRGATGGGAPNGAGER